MCSYQGRMNTAKKMLFGCVVLHFSSYGFFLRGVAAWYQCLQLLITAVQGPEGRLLPPQDVA